MTDPIVAAQHDETGRMWRGPLSQLPSRFAVVSGSPDTTLNAPEMLRLGAAAVLELERLMAENERLREALEDAAIMLRLFETGRKP
jgi:hypothetical protein